MGGLPARASAHPQVLVHGEASGDVTVIPNNTYTRLDERDVVFQSNFWLDSNLTYYWTEHRLLWRWQFDSNTKGGNMKFKVLIRPNVTSTIRIQFDDQAEIVVKFECPFSKDSQETTPSDRGLCHAQPRRWWFSSRSTPSCASRICATATWPSSFRQLPSTVIAPARISQRTRPQMELSMTWRSARGTSRTRRIWSVFHSSNMETLGRCHGNL